MNLFPHRAICKIITYNIKNVALQFSYGKLMLKKCVTFDLHAFLIYNLFRYAAIIIFRFKIVILTRLIVGCLNLISHTLSSCGKSCNRKFE